MLLVPHSKHGRRVFSSSPSSLMLVIALLVRDADPLLSLSKGGMNALVALSLAYLEAVEETAAASPDS